MKAARFCGINKPLKLEEVPIPKIGAQEVLVRIKASGVCASDLHYYHGKLPFGKIPITMGHECTGIVEEVGSEVEGLMKGERVCIHYIISCGNCYFCSTGRDNLCVGAKFVGFDEDGGFAEYIRVPARNVVKLPKEIPFEEGAIIGCAVVTPFHALRIGEVKPGEVLAIYGLGGVGIHGIQFARNVFGAIKIIAVDIMEYKLQLAIELGADVVVNAKENDPVEIIKKETGGRGVDVALDFVGLRETIQQCLRSVGRGGRVVLVGLCKERVEIDPLDLLFKEVEVKGSIDHTRWELLKTIELVEKKRIDLSRSITHKLSLHEVNRGLEILDKKIGEPVRVVIVQR